MQAKNYFEWHLHRVKWLLASRLALGNNSFFGQTNCLAKTVVKKGQYLFSLVTELDLNNYLLIIQLGSPEDLISGLPLINLASFKNRSTVSNADTVMASGAL